MNKLRFTQHTEHTALMQLQVYIGGMWYTIEGTTVHSCNDIGKSKLLKKYEARL